MSRKLVKCERQVSTNALRQAGVRSVIDYLEREVELAKLEVARKAETLNPRGPLEMVAEIRVSVYTYVDAPEATVRDA